MSEPGSMKPRPNVLKGISIAAVGEEQHGDGKEIRFKGTKFFAVMQKGVLDEEPASGAQDFPDFFKDLKVFRRRIDMEDIGIPDDIIIVF
jgi:hypothetical protein